MSVSGRVLTPDGSGLRNAKVVITDPTGAERTVTTGPSGYFQFNDVKTGETYIIGVSSQRFGFASRVLQVFDTLADVDFVGNE